MPRSAAAVEKFFQLSLLGLVASGFLAVAGSGYLDTATTLLTTAGLLLRAAMTVGWVRLNISDRAVTILTIAYIGFYPLDYQFLSRDFLTVMVTIGVLALTSGLFFLLPRTANAALRHLAAKGYFLQGFSNQVMLGQIGELKTRSTAVMHVRVANNGGRLNAKWRGAALSDFDGKKWYNTAEADSRMPVRRDGQVILADDTQRRRRGKRVAYRVDVNGIDTAVPFLAGTPEVVNLNASILIRTANDSYRVGVGSADGLRYDVYSFFDDDTDPA